jgi:hypothetical protein
MDIFSSALIGDNMGTPVSLLKPPSCSHLAEPDSPEIVFISSRTRQVRRNATDRRVDREPIEIFARWNSKRRMRRARRAR